jgi:hypothetical protein
MTRYGWVVRVSNPGGVRFFVPLRIGPGAHPASCTVSTGSLPRVKRPGRGADHLLPSGAEVDGLAVYPCVSRVPALAYRGVTFTFILQIL